MMTGQSTFHPRKRAFTLIELLVVIAIISLLISIILPALSSARRAANTTVCLTRLHSIGEGMIMYGLDNEDWIIGAPAGSGAYLTSNAAWGPATQRWDWMGPMARQWGIPLPEAMGFDTAKRFNLLRGLKQFSCPQNDFLSSWFDGPNAGTGPMVSYNTSRYMLFEHGPGGQIGVTNYDNQHEEQIPNGWSPRLTRMGDVSRKVFAADGSRFATVNILPDYDLRAQAGWGGAFSDVAPYSIWSRSWDRSGMTGGGTDARNFSFRHSRGAPQDHARADVYKMNLVFMDGHAETLGDLQAANPRFWLPKGSTLLPGGAYEDVAQFYGLGQPLDIN